MIAVNKEIKLNVIGMGCQSCVKTIKDALNARSGVKQTKVSLEKEEAEIVYDSKIVEVNQLIETIKNSGYDAEIK